jgi:hypothetical protein
LPTASLQHNALIFTVNPDKTVGINWNSTTYSSVLQNQSASFPTGDAIHSSSSFSPQSNGIVETTSFQYTVPQQAYVSNPFLSDVNSINLTASQTGTSSEGSLTFYATLPVEQAAFIFSTSPNEINANVTAQIAFSSTYNGTPLALFANQTAFGNEWSQTFGNPTWTDNTVSQIQNSTYHILFVKNFNGTMTSTSSSANIFVEFIAIPGGSATSFLAALENILNPIVKMPTAFDYLIQSLQNLVTGETMSLTYNGTTRLVSFKSTITFASNLDAQLNSIKDQYFQMILNKTAPNSPQDTFLNSTSITVSKMSMQSSADLNAGTYSSSLVGTVITPPVVESSNTNFTIPGLFTTLNSTTSSNSKMNITLVGGSDPSNQVKVIVPAGIPDPTSTTSNSATWMNVKNASELQDVRFEIQPLPTPFSLLGFLTSTTGFVLEAILAAAVIAGVALYARKRRSRISTSMTQSGPTTSPGFGPSPASPAQWQPEH